MTREDTSSAVLSQVYHSLRASRRRYLIQLLAETDEDHLSVRKCARHITAIEEEVQPEKATGEPYRNTYNSLSQTHVPTLSDAGIILYDPDRQTVSSGPNMQFAMLIIAINRATIQSLQDQRLNDFEGL
mgnify:CR=1 FL=1